METTPSSSLTRYRPVVLAITGFAALYGAFIVYKSAQSTSPAPTQISGIHRSNAVHRPRRRTRLGAPSPEERASAEQPTPRWSPFESYGQVEITNGQGQVITINLTPNQLPTPQSLQEEHGLSEEAAQVALHGIHQQFVSRFLVMHFSQDNSPEQAEVEAYFNGLGISSQNQIRGFQNTVRDAERVTGGALDDETSTIAGTEVDIATFGSRNGRSGLNLKQLLYHIAESQARADGFLHRGFRCDMCNTSPIRGIRWKCANCVDLDLCNECHATCIHARNHIFYEIRVPTYSMNNLTPVSELAYPGRVDLTKSPMLTGDVLKDIVDRSGMEKSEVEGLFEQFNCLATVPFTGDSLEYAVDRQTFPHIISPLSSYAPLRTNLVFDRLFSLFDTNRDNLISFEEFVHGVNFLRTRSANHSLEGKKYRWKKTFQAYDIDGDGVITRRDCLRMFRALYSIQRDLALDLLSTNEAINGLRDATAFAEGGRPISAAFTQNPRTVPDARVPLNKNRNAYGDIRHQPGQDVVAPNGSLQGDASIIHGYEWESQAQFPFDHRTGEPLSLKDFLYLAPRDQSGQAPAHIARDQKVHFEFDGEPLSKAREKAVQERSKRKAFYDSGYEIPSPPQDLTKDIALQVLESALNELVDPLFKAREDLHFAAHAAKSEIEKWGKEIDDLLARQRKAREDAEKAKADPLMTIAAAAEEASRLEAQQKQEMERQAHGVNGYARGAVTMDEVVTNIERGVGAQPLEELLESEGFAVRGDEPAGESRGETEATHLDISTAPQPSPVDESRSMRLAPLVQASNTVAEVAHRDPTMPQFRPNSEEDIVDNEPRNVIVDPLRRPAPVPSSSSEKDKRPKFEAEIIRQFEHMFLGWERDADSGLVVNAATTAHQASSSKSEERDQEALPTEERLNKLAELREYLTTEMGKRDVPGLTEEEFVGFVADVYEDGNGRGSELKFLEGWLEVVEEWAAKGERTRYVFIEELLHELLSEFTGDIVMQAMDEVVDEDGNEEDQHASENVSEHVSVDVSVDVNDMVNDEPNEEFTNQDVNDQSTDQQAHDEFPESSNREHGEPPDVRPGGTSSANADANADEDADADESPRFATTEDIRAYGARLEAARQAEYQRRFQEAVIAIRAMSEEERPAMRAEIVGEIEAHGGWGCNIL